MFVLRRLIGKKGYRRHRTPHTGRAFSSWSVEALESRHLLNGGGSHTPPPLRAPGPISLRVGAVERRAPPILTTQAGQETVRTTIRRLTGALQAQLTDGLLADLNTGRIDGDGFTSGVAGLVVRFKQDVDRQLLPTRPRMAARLKDQADQLQAQLIAQVRQHDDDHLALHIHPHLAIVINGRPLTIPANIGITPRGTNPVHTHDDSGKIHVESDVPRTFYLKDFFAAWGRTFTRRNLLGYRADAAHEITMTVNGQPGTEFGDLVLRDHDEIVLRYGPSRPGSGGGRAPAGLGTANPGARAPGAPGPSS